MDQQPSYIREQIMKTLFVALTALAVIAFPSFSTAQPWSGGSNLSLGAPTGELAKVASSGFGYGALLGYALSSSFKLNASLMNTKFGVKGSDLSNSGEIDIAMIEIGGEYLPFDRGDSSAATISPFVRLGVGGYLIVASVGSSVEGINSTGIEAAWGIAPSVGVMVPIQSARIRLEPVVTYHTILTEGISTSFVSFDIGFEGYF
jgi:hypothetical protein